MEDKIVKKRTEEEAKALFQENTNYIVLNKKIHEDTKGNVEMDLTLFDVNAKDEQKAILSLSVKDFSQSSRIAQDHEVEHARKLLKDYRESVWAAEDLNS